MYLDDIKTVEIELTNLCNAGCPLCFRHNNDIILNSIDIDKLLQFLSKLKNLQKIILCGNAGEPTQHKEIIKFLSSLSVYVEIYSNGNIQKRILHSLSQALPFRHMIEIAIDGIDNKTQQMSRPGIKLDSIDKNIEYMESVGINVHVVFTRYLHNEDQEDAMRSKYNNLKVRDTRYTSSVLKYPSDFSTYIIPSDRVFKDKAQFTRIFKLKPKYTKYIFVSEIGNIYPCDVIARRTSSTKYSIYDYKMMELADQELQCNSITTALNGCMYSCKYDL
jgi:MoaA/NifB/PqqE/SkfB family radical SAM enzyme